MTNQEKATFIADQCKPCTDDFYSGIYQGVLLVLNSEKDTDTDDSGVLDSETTSHLNEQFIILKR